MSTPAAAAAAAGDAAVVLETRPVTPHVPEAADMDAHGSSALRTALLLSGAAEAVVHGLKQRLATGKLSAALAYYGGFALAKIAGEATAAEPLVVMGAAPLMLKLLHRHAADQQVAEAACTTLAHLTLLEPCEGSPCRVSAEELYTEDVAGALAAVLASHPSEPSAALPACAVIVNVARQPAVHATLVAHADLSPNARGALGQLERRLTAVTAGGAADAAAELGDGENDHHDDGSADELARELKTTIKSCKTAIALLEAVEVTAPAPSTA